MKNMSFIMVASGVLAFIFGCGLNTPGKTKATSPTAQTFKTEISGQEFIVLNTTDLESSGTKVAGTGSFLFKSPRPKVDSNYDLTFLLSAGSSFVLVTNADDKLQRGVTLTFRRTDKTLKLQLQVGAENFDLSSDLQAVDASASVNLNVDIHAHGHIVLFIAGQRFEYAFSTSVPGRFWGIILDKSVLLNATAGSAKVEG